MFLLAVQTGDSSFAVALGAIRSESTQSNFRELSPELFTRIDHRFQILSIAPGMGILDDCYGSNLAQAWLAGFTGFAQHIFDERVEPPDLQFHTPITFRGFATPPSTNSRLRPAEQSVPAGCCRAVYRSRL